MNKKEYMKEYNSRSEFKEYQKEYRLRPEVIEVKRKYYIKNKEFMREYGSRPEQKAKRRKYGSRPEVKARIKEYNSSPEVKVRVKEYNKEYLRNLYNSDKEHRLKVLMRTRLNQTLKKYVKTGKNKSSLQYGINYLKIIEHLKPFPDNLKDYHVHHIKPLFTFNFINEDGSENLKEIKKAFSPENHKLILMEDHRKINHWRLKPIPKC